MKSLHPGGVTHRIEEKRIFGLVERSNGHTKATAKSCHVLFELLPLE